MPFKYSNQPLTLHSTFALQEKEAGKQQALLIAAFTFVSKPPEQSQSPSPLNFNAYTAPTWPRNSAPSPKPGRPLLKWCMPAPVVVAAAALVVAPPMGELAPPRKPESPLTSRRLLGTCKADRGFTEESSPVTPASLLPDRKLLLLLGGVGARISGKVALPGLAEESRPASYCGLGATAASADRRPPSECPSGPAPKDDGPALPGDNRLATPRPLASLLLSLGL